MYQPSPASLSAGSLRSLPLVYMSQHQVMPLSARVTPSPQPAAQIVWRPPWLPPEATRFLPSQPLTVFRYWSARLTRRTMPLK